MLLENITKEFILEWLSKIEIELYPTQKKLCVPIINRIYKKMKIGIQFSGIKVENILICDGHHRYVASLLAGYPIERIPTHSTSASVQLHWPVVVFETEDWDTEAKINMLNEQDANYNNVPIEKMIELLK